MSNEKKTAIVDGRLVWIGGDLFKGEVDTDFQTRQPKLDAQGNPKIKWTFGVAVNKEVLTQVAAGQPGEFWRMMQEEAQKIFPSGVPANFSWKYKDGDGVDHTGKPFSQRTGYAGHVVLQCSTIIPPRFFKYENGQYVQIDQGIKCGDYVRVQMGIAGHNGQGGSRIGNPGLYLNPYAVCITGYGEEIVNAPSAEQMFGAQAPPVPQGASATPIAPAAPMPGMAAPIQPEVGVLPPQHQQVFEGQQVDQMQQQQMNQQFPSAPAMPAQAPQSNMGAPQMPQANQPAPAMPGMPQLK